MTSRGHRRRDSIIIEDRKIIMSHTRKILFISLLVLLNAGCASKSYVVNIYEVDNEHLVEVQSLYKKTTEHLANNTKGRFLSKPLIVEKELTSPSMPKYTEPLQGNVITVLEFPNKKSAKQYLKNEKTVALRHFFSPYVKSETSFFAKPFNPLGMLGNEPLLGDIEHRQAPAFILVNALTMKSFLNPATPYRILQYKNNNFAKVKALGVNMFTPLIKTKAITGEYEQELLFLTEWPSEEVFDTLHSDEEFIELSRRTRNKAFSGFTDTKATFSN